MSSNKRRRVDNEDGDTSYEDSTDIALAKIAKLRQLVSDTLLHDTYCPLFLKFLEMRFIVTNVVLISKYHNNLLFNHPLSYSLSRSIASNDYGRFLTDSPFSKHFRKPKIKDSQSLIKELYIDFSHFFTSGDPPKEG